MRFILLLLFFCLNLESFGQNCPSLTDGTEAAAGNLGYRSRDNGDHCEGLVTNTNSAGVDLDVVSFTKGPLNYYASDTELITIKNLFPAPVPVNVHGRNFNMSVHYRLDLDLKGVEAKTIPAGAVIAKARIVKENMGLYGRVAGSRQAVYCPVKVSSKQVPRSSSDSTYLLVLLKNVTFKSLGFRYAAYNNGDAGRFSQDSPILPDQIKGDRIIVRLPGAMKGGTYVLRMYYELTSGLKSGLDFTLRLP